MQTTREGKLYKTMAKSTNNEDRKQYRFHFSQITYHLITGYYARVVTYISHIMQLKIYN